jgi:hypothetical protein
LDIARFGEDETGRRASRGRWIRLHRAQHKADTMTTGHIAKAYRDIREERGVNDFPTIVVDVVGVGAGVFDRLAELGLPVAASDGGEAPFDKERFVNARADDYWNLRELFENGEIDIDELDDKPVQLGSIKRTSTHESRSNRRRIYGNGECRHLIARTPSRWHFLAVVLRRRWMECHAGEAIMGDPMTKAW